MRERPSLAGRAVLAVARARNLGVIGAAVLALAPSRAQAPQTHWAFVPPVKNVPVVRDAAWCRDDIDRCVLAGLERDGLRPNAPAAPAVLLRRVHLVLTGLPPTPAQVAAFAADPSDAAYVRTVDALLADDACAEHLATDWLDLARFADTYGYQSDFECRTWPWRDWLLRALASDMPWNRFVDEIVAGDLLPRANVDTRTATAFWRLHRQTNEGGSIAEEFRHEHIADRVDTLGAAFLGLTLGCARCHDHKTDPITQRDYYNLGSFFAIDETGLYPYSTGATPRPVVRLATPEQERQRTELRAGVQELASRRPPPKLEQKEVLRTPIGAAEPILRVRFDRPDVSPPVTRNLRLVPIPAGMQSVAGRTGTAVECDGDARITIGGVPAFTRDDAFSLQLFLWCPDEKERAVVLHTSHFTEDADAQGYQLLLEEGRLSWQLVHVWPGSAIAVRMDKPFPLQRWCEVVVTYDGSSTASGLRVYLDGEPMATSIVRDHLDGPTTVRTLELGGRDRDKGFTGGRIEEFAVFDHCVTAAEVAVGKPRRPLMAAIEGHFWDRDPDVAKWRAELLSAQKALHAFEETMPELMVMAAHPYPPERYVLRRGAYDQPDRHWPVLADVPARVLPWDFSGPRDRSGLARWLNDVRNPLPARVVVDRTWAKCFGRGLVPTPENFGVSGTPPSQQVLLDALAVDFANDRSVKRLLRRIVLSATFRQNSAATAQQREADPYDERLARGPSFRLCAEVLRDQALAACGLLHRELGGPSVKPFQPPGLWRDAGAGWGGADYKPDTGANAHRRSLYTFRKRTAPPPNMMALDGTSREVCIVRRQETNTPLQALVVLGDPVFTECAQALAANAHALPDADLDTRLVFVFQSLASRAPREPELAALRTLCAQEREPLRALALVASTVMASDAAMVLR